MLPRHSPAFLEFLEPAREKSQFWRTLLGFVLLGVVYMALMTGIIPLLVLGLNKIDPGLGNRIISEQASHGFTYLVGIGTFLVAFILRAWSKFESWPQTAVRVAYLILFAVALAGTIPILTFVLEQIRIGSGYQMLFQLKGGRTISATLVTLAAISMLIPALWLVLRIVHKRPLSSLISPNGRVNWPHWRTAALIVLAIGSIDIVVTLLSSEVTQQMPLMKWLMWLAPALILLFLQTTAEELIFRGYILQQLAARFKSRWIWWILPSALFGAAHYNPATFGDNVWFVIAATTLMGLILSDITTRFGSISAAMGLHFANNLLVLLIVNSSGQLSGLSLYLNDVDLKNPDLQGAMAISLGVMAFVYGIFLMIMRRRRL